MPPFCLSIPRNGLHAPSGGLACIFHALQLHFKESSNFFSTPIERQRGGVNNSKEPSQEGPKDTREYERQEIVQLLYTFPKHRSKDFKESQYFKLTDEFLVQVIVGNFFKNLKYVSLFCKEQ